MRNAGAVVSICLLLVACDRGAAPSEPLFDVAQVSRVAEPKLIAMWERPAVSAAMRTFLDAVVASKDVRAQDSALAAELTADPQVTGPIQSLMSALEADPAMRAAVVAVMLAHPDASPDQASVLFGEHLEEVWGRPPFVTAWTESFGRFVTELEHEPALAAVERTLSARAARRYNDVEVTRRWNQRILELAGGSAPTREQATELLLAHMLVDQRLDEIGVELLGNATLRAETSAALAKLLAMKSVSRELHQAATTFLSDPTVRAAVLDLFHQLVTEQPERAAVVRALDTMLATPALADAVHELIRIAATDPDAQAIFAAWLDHVSADPALATTFDKVVYGW